MYVTNHHDMTLAVKVALNLNTTNQIHYKKNLVLIDWMVFYATFNIISVISRQQLTLFMLFPEFHQSLLGLWTVLSKDTPMKNLKI